MKKKTEVIEILNQGGRITVDTIYRTARVYTATEWESDSSGDSCRYDVAEKLTQTAGYKKVKTDWYASYHIVKETAAEEAAPAAEEAEPEYLEEAWPESNSAPGITYILKYRTRDGGLFYKKVDTMEAVRSHAQQIKSAGGHIEEAARIDKNAVNTRGYRREFIPETRQEKTDRENREHCQRIAETLEAYANGNYYKCPDCGGVHHWDDVEESEHEDEAGWAVYTCPDCGAEIAEDDWEQQSLYDYFSDCYDIEYRCDGKREYRSVCIMVACGGPNIYIDTSSKAVELYWWTDRARYSLSSDAVDAVDDWAEEYWNCY